MLMLHRKTSQTEVCAQLKAQARHWKCKGCKENWSVKLKRCETDGCGLLKDSEVRKLSVSARQNLFPAND